jgi:predicted Zn finger-like uncharacterized protein
MDVRCEKCQTEYELDESRLKPGGVTVKCTNCGHMFKIRKRTNTNVGMPVVGEPPRPRTSSSKPPVDATTDRIPRADSVLADGEQGSGPNQTERQWLIRLQNGEQKSCRELATLQQWIVAGVVTRESLISRSGKTWKRLGDIGELAQYFIIADDAKAQRSARPTNKPLKPEDPRSTMLGVGAGPKASGGSIHPDDDDESRSTGNFRARPSTPPPPPGANRPANPMAQTELAPSIPQARRPPTQPPPPPPARGPQMPAGNRSTAAWASNDVKASESMAAMPQGPQSGRLTGVPEEPAFAGQVRMAPGDESSFRTGKVGTLEDDDDDVLPPARSSRVGMVIAVIAVIMIGAAAGVVYMVLTKKKDTTAQKPPADAAVVAAAPADAPAPPPPTPDAAPEVSPLDAARADIAANIEANLTKTLDALASKDDPPTLAMRARVVTTLVQALQDRAGLVPDKAAADKLRKQAKQLVIDGAGLAQRALKALPDDPGANLAMADVLRLQGKPARDVKRYLDQARAKIAADKQIARELALADGLLAMRESKLDDAQILIATGDTDPSDVRPKLQLALIAYAQTKPADAKPLVEQVLATQPEHAGARALQARLDTMVAKSDPLPPEDHGGSGSGSSATHVVRPPTNDNVGGGTDYDSLLARANKLAETNCTKAMDVFQKALEQKPNGVEALTGMGYCHIDAKQFASAFSKFRAALAVSSRYEPALSGVAEAYQQQGRKEQAIDAWKAYLEVYPGSAKAKKQLEILGADSGGTGGSGSPTPTPTPTPTPVPTPAPAGSGSGSG